MFSEIYFFHKCLFLYRKAASDDLPEISQVVNAAYAIEIGSEGVSFKSANRYSEYPLHSKTDPRDPERDLPFLYILRHESTPRIVGVVKAKLIEDNRVVEIGPLAVHPDFQVTEKRSQKKANSFLECLVFQGQGHGSRLLRFAESLAKKAQIQVVSCRSDLFGFYDKRGYKETGRVPAETYIPPKYMTRQGLQMIIMQKEH